MTTSIPNWMRGIVLVLAISAGLIAGTASAQAAGGWSYDGKDTWVLTDSAGVVQQIRIDHDSDRRIDVLVYPRSHGPFKWIALDTFGGPRIDTWVYQYSDGRKLAYLDFDENGRYEIQGYDGNRDGYYEWVRTDTNRDGTADYWMTAAQYSNKQSVLTIPRFGTSMINAGNPCNNSTFTCSGAGLVTMGHISDRY